MKVVIDFSVNVRSDGIFYHHTVARQPVSPEDLDILAWEDKIKIAMYDTPFTLVHMYTELDPNYVSPEKYFKHFKKCVQNVLQERIQKSLSKLEKEKDTLLHLMLWAQE